MKVTTGWETGLVFVYGDKGRSGIGEGKMKNEGEQRISEFTSWND